MRLSCASSRYRWSMRFGKASQSTPFRARFRASQVKAFIDRVIKAAGSENGDSLSDAVASAEEMLQEGAVADAAQVCCRQFSRKMPRMPPHMPGLVRSYLALDQVGQARAAAFERAGANWLRHPRFHAVKAQLATRAPGGRCRTCWRVEGRRSKPVRTITRHDLIWRRHFTRRATPKRRSRRCLNSIVAMRIGMTVRQRRQLFTIFDALKPDDPVVLNGRRKLSSMIFA